MAFIIFLFGLVSAILCGKMIADMIYYERVGLDDILIALILAVNGLIALYIALPML